MKIKTAISCIIILLLPGLLFCGIIRINGYVLDIRGNPIRGNLVLSTSDSSYTFPVNPIDGRVEIFLSGIENRFNKNRPVNFLLQPGYPNPFDDKTSFDLVSAITTQGAFTLFNVLGQRVYSSSFPISSGITTFELSGTLAAGIYFLQITTPGGKQNIKLTDINGNFNDRNSLVIKRTQKNSSDINIKRIELKQLLNYKNDNSVIFKINAKGTTQEGDSLSPYQTIRYANQDPAEENVVTASFHQGHMTSMLLDINELKEDFILYALDQSLDLDTLANISAPFFRNSWQDIHIDQYLFEYNYEGPGPKIGEKPFLLQNNFIRQLNNALVISTPLEKDTLIRITHDTTAYPNWAESGYRVWFIDNDNFPSHGGLYRWVNGNFQLVYGEARVRETDGWSTVIEEYATATVVGFHSFMTDDFKTMHVQPLISKFDGTQWFMNQQGIDFFRIAMLFKGKMVVPLK